MMDLDPSGSTQDVNYVIENGAPPSSSCEQTESTAIASTLPLFDLFTITGIHESNIIKCAPFQSDPTAGKLSMSSTSVEFEVASRLSYSMVQGTFLEQSQDEVTLRGVSDLESAIQGFCFPNGSVEVSEITQDLKDPSYEIFVWTMDPMAMKQDEVPTWRPSKQSGMLEMRNLFRYHSQEAKNDENRGDVRGGQHLVYLVTLSFNQVISIPERLAVMVRIHQLKTQLESNGETLPSELGALLKDCISRPWRAEPSEEPLISWNAPTCMTFCSAHPSICIFKQVLEYLFFTRKVYALGWDARALVSLQTIRSLREEASTDNVEDSRHCWSRSRSVNLPLGELVINFMEGEPNAKELRISPQDVVSKAGRQLLAKLSWLNRGDETSVQYLCPLPPTYRAPSYGCSTPRPSRPTLPPGVTFRGVGEFSYNWSCCPLKRVELRPNAEPSLSLDSVKMSGSWTDPEATSCICHQCINDITIDKGDCFCQIGRLSFNTLFSLCSSFHIFLMIKSLLRDSSVIVVGSKRSERTAVILGLQALISPFRWSFPFLPLCHGNVADTLAEAPMPVLISAETMPTYLVPYMARVAAFSNRYRVKQGNSDMDCVFGLDADESLHPRSQSIPYWHNGFSGEALNKGVGREELMIVATNQTKEMGVVLDLDNRCLMLSDSLIEGDITRIDSRSSRLTAGGGVNMVLKSNYSKSKVEGSKSTFSNQEPIRCILIPHDSHFVRPFAASYHMIEEIIKFYYMNAFIPIKLYKGLAELFSILEKEMCIPEVNANTSTPYYKPKESDKSLFSIAKFFSFAGSKSPHKKRAEVSPNASTEDDVQSAPEDGGSTEGGHSCEYFDFGEGAGQAVNVPKDEPKDETQLVKVSKCLFVLSKVIGHHYDVALECIINVFQKQMCNLASFALVYELLLQIPDTTLSSPNSRLNFICECVGVEPCSTARGHDSVSPSKLVRVVSIPSINAPTNIFAKILAEEDKPMGKPEVSEMCHFQYTDSCWKNHLQVITSLVPDKVRVLDDLFIYWSRINLDGHSQIELLNENCHPYKHLMDRLLANGGKNYFRLRSYNNPDMIADRDLRFFEDHLRTVSESLDKLVPRYLAKATAPASHVGKMMSMRSRSVISLERGEAEGANNGCVYFEENTTACDPDQSKDLEALSTTITQLFHSHLFQTLVEQIENKIE
eukprot:GHVH01006578.1.p1 GENE.GHVH01006578.1~~GHVH01006578.1.p1  ORF type:complete len:1178 (-),score=175.21 GHVH01006578.1:3420-6953(-)